MTEITTVFLLLLAVILSGQIARFLPWSIPLPLVQIAFGAVLASVFNLGIELEPHVFFLLFLPPLLFLDGWRIPKTGLFKDGGTIVSLAFGLVILTVLLIGLFINWMIPAMPMAVCFALAAIISPTDPVAVSAIASKLSMPKRMMHILEGESLLNDASGLVCMRFAVAAALTGAFSLSGAALTFAWLVVAGIGIGVAFTAAVMWTKDMITLRLGEDAGSQILLSLLIPFGAYMLAEAVHASGILAAVASGVTMSYAEQSGRLMAATRVRRTAVWDVLQYALNGVIFVLLGEQLPKIVEGAAIVVIETGHHSPAWLAIYVVAINLALAVLRFVWVWGSLYAMNFRSRAAGTRAEMPSLRLAAVMSVAGVRGAITLAGILTLPLLMNDGMTAFPARDLAIFLAAGVILLSMMAASIGLPLLLKDLPVMPESAKSKAEEKAGLAAAEKAIQAVENMQHEKSKDGGHDELSIYAEAAARVIDIYHTRLNGNSQSEEEAVRAQQAEKAERALRLAALRAERDEIFRLGRLRQVPDDVVRKMVKDIDLAEARLLA